MKIPASAKLDREAPPTTSKAKCVTDNDESLEYQEAVLDPNILEMIADDLDNRATTLQAEAKRAADDGEQLQEMAEKIRE